MRCLEYSVAAFTMINLALAVSSPYTNSSSKTISSYNSVKSFYSSSQSVTIITPSSAAIWTSSKETPSTSPTESESLIISSHSSITTKSSIISSFIISSSISEYASSSSTFSSTTTFTSPILTGEVVNSNIPLWTILVPGSMGTWESLQVEITKSGIGGSFVYDQAALTVNDVIDSSASIDISAESISVEYSQSAGLDDLVAIKFGASITGASSNWTSHAVLTITFPGEQKLSKRSYTVAYTFDSTIETKNGEVVEPSSTTAVSSDSSSGAQDTSPGSKETSTFEPTSSESGAFSGIISADASSGVSSTESRTSTSSNKPRTPSTGEAESSSGAETSAAELSNYSAEPEMSSGELISSLPYQSISLITPSTASVWNSPSEASTYSESAFESESFILSASSSMPGEPFTISPTESFASETFAISTTALTSGTEPFSVTRSSTSSSASALAPIFTGVLIGDIPEWKIKIPAGLGPWSALDVDITKKGSGGPFTFSYASVEEDEAKTDSRGIHLTPDTINFDFDEFIGKNDYLSFTFAGKISARASNWTAHAHIVISRPGKAKLFKRDELVYDIEYTVSTPNGEEVDPSHSSSDVVSLTSEMSSPQSSIMPSTETIATVEMTRNTVGQSLKPSGSTTLSKTITSSEATLSVFPLTSVTPTPTNTRDQSTTVVSITSCSADSCSTEDVAIGYAVVTTTKDGTITSYTSYCPLSEVITTVTQEAASTTVVTVTSCSANICNKVPQTIGYNLITTTENGIMTTYTTYCPLSTEGQVTKADAQNGVTAASPNPDEEYGTTTLTFTTCHDGSCSEIPITKVHIHTVTSTTENGLTAVSTSFKPVETVAVNDNTRTAAIYESEQITAIVLTAYGTTTYVESTVSNNLTSTISKSELTDGATGASPSHSTDSAPSAIGTIGSPATLAAVNDDSSAGTTIGVTSNFVEAKTSVDDDNTLTTTMTATATGTVAPALVDTASEGTFSGTSATTLQSDAHQTSLTTTAISGQTTGTLSIYEGSGSPTICTSLAVFLAVLLFI